MHIQEFSFRLFVLAALMSLFACSSGGGGGSDDTPDDVDTVDIPVAPVFTSIVSGDGRVNLTWTHIDEPATDVTDGAPVLTYNLYYANATDNDTTIDDLLADYTEVEEIEAVSGYQVVEDIAALEYTVFGLDNLDLYYFILTAVAAEEIDGVVTVAEGDASVSEAIAMPRASAVPDQPVADTGVTLCGDYTYGIEAQDVNDDGLLSFDEIDLDGDEDYYEHDNRIDCLVGDLDDDLDPIPAPAQQDYAQGLDASTNDDADGAAGFSYTKLGETGVALDVAADEWFCVLDNVTGLTWEVKTYTDVEEDEDLHHSKDRFSWYSEDTTTNGEEPGYDIPSNATANGGEGDDICFGYTEDDEATYCNTSAFIERVNDEALCGYSDWRLPDLIELRSLVNYGLENDDTDNLVAAVDLAYFPNMEVDGGIEGTTIDGGIRYWSNHTYSGSATSSAGETIYPAATLAWSIYYGYGGAPALDKGTPNAVRLVRSDP